VHKEDLPELLALAAKMLDKAGLIKKDKSYGPFKIINMRGMY